MEIINNNVTVPTFLRTLRPKTFDTSAFDFVRTHLIFDQLTWTTFSVRNLKNCTKDCASRYGKRLPL